MASFNPADWYNGFKKVLKGTSIEILLLGALGATVAAYVATKHESKRTEMIPLAFSEISQVQKEAAQNGKEVGPMAMYLMGLNDCLMKIFESWNDSHKKDRVNEFASELRSRMDPNRKDHHYNLADFLGMMPSLAEGAKDQLDDFIDASNHLSPIIGSLSAAWDYRSRDNYHTEIYTTTETYTDSEGRSHSRLVTKTREVYDDTDHYYTYNSNHGEQASRLLDELAREYPSLRFNEDMRIAGKTNAEGENAARKTRPRKDDEPEFTKAELIEIAATWRNGSTLMQNLPTIYLDMDGLIADANEWRTAKNGSASIHYRNTHRTDPSPPRGFTIVENALTHATGASSSINEIVSGISYVESNLPVLKEKIELYTSLENTTGAEIDRKKLREEIMDISKEMYKRNFKEGVDVDRFRWWYVALLTFLGGVVGGVLGLGADRLGNKYNLYDDGVFSRRETDI